MYGERQQQGREQNSTVRCGSKSSKKMAKMAKSRLTVCCERDVSAVNFGRILVLTEPSRVAFGKRAKALSTSVFTPCNNAVNVQNKQITDRGSRPGSPPQPSRAARNISLLLPQQSKVGVFPSPITHPVSSISVNKHYVRLNPLQGAKSQHSTAQHSTAQHSTAQHSTAQHSTAQHSTAQHSTQIVDI
jgi:hypothetical protein